MIYTSHKRTFNNVINNVIVVHMYFQLYEHRGNNEIEKQFEVT